MTTVVVEVVVLCIYFHRHGAEAALYLKWTSVEGRPIPFMAAAGNNPELGVGRTAAPRDWNRKKARETEALSALLDLPPLVRLTEQTPPWAGPGLT